MYTLDPGKSREVRMRFLWNYAILFGIGGFVLVMVIRLNGWVSVAGLLGVVMYSIWSLALALQHVAQKLRAVQAQQYEVTPAFIRRLATHRTPDITIYWADVTDFHSLTGPSGWARRSHIA